MGIGGISNNVIAFVKVSGKGNLERLGKETKVVIVQTRIHATGKVHARQSV